MTTISSLLPSSQCKPRLRKYYASINMHLHKLAKMTTQLKENIVSWLNQDGTFNPADKLGTRGTAP